MVSHPNHFFRRRCKVARFPSQRRLGD
jgi:hypothetical protein